MRQKKFAFDMFSLQIFFNKQKNYIKLKVLPQLSLYSYFESKLDFNL